ncbi:hypothetical protein, partial [Pyrobaculum sp.]|uniref:hypothetical protein n=1 Tax=Pyrobaculum sp. TaxID=2004705 RepID=UPI00316E9B4E
VLWEKTLPDNTLVLSYPSIVRTGDSNKNGNWAAGVIAVYLAKPLPPSVLGQLPPWVRRFVSPFVQ